MIIKQLENVRKKDSLLYYRDVYLADAVFELGANQKQEKASIEITIEKTAIGETRINVLINSQINYPMLPALKSLKNFVSGRHAEGLFT